MLRVKDNKNVEKKRQIKIYINIKKKDIIKQEKILKEAETDEERKHIQKDSRLKVMPFSVPSFTRYKSQTVSPNLFHCKIPTIQYDNKVPSCYKLHKVLMAVICV